MFGDAIPSISNLERVRGIPDILSGPRDPGIVRGGPAVTMDSICLVNIY